MNDARTVTIRKTRRLHPADPTHSVRMNGVGVGNYYSAAQATTARDMILATPAGQEPDWLAIRRATVG